MAIVYALIALFGTAVIAVVALNYFCDMEFWKGATAVVLALVVLSVSMSGMFFESDKEYAKKDFTSGMYKVDTSAVIENCDGKADELAIKLIDNGVDTCYIEPNIGKWDLEYVCTILKSGQDVRVYIRHKDLKKMLSNEYIKLVTE